MNPNQITNCQRCTASLERGYSTRYVNNECKEVICFKCDRDEEFSDYLKNKTITSHLMLNNSLELFQILTATREPTRLEVYKNNEDLIRLRHRLDIQIATNNIQKKIKEFDQKVWFKGLQKMILDTTVRGVSAKLKKYNNFRVLTYSIAGRTMITFEDDMASVTAVADETSTESRTGLHGITANGEEALYLIDLAIKLYESGELKFVEDTKVSMI